jgi:hypothetical protein
LLPEDILRTFPVLKLFAFRQWKNKVTKEIRICYLLCYNDNIIDKLIKMSAIQFQKIRKGSSNRNMTKLLFTAYYSLDPFIASFFLLSSYLTRACRNYSHLLPEIDIMKTSLPNCTLTHTSVAKYSETSLNRAINKTESSINRDLNKALCRKYLLI